MDVEKVLRNLVRIGTVTDTDNGGLKARVRFQDIGVTSDWLFVVQNQAAIPDYLPAEQHTEIEEGHKHKLIIKPWMPRVNDTVVCLYLPIWNGDGFILGRVGK